MTMMIEQDPNDIQATGPDSPDESRNSGRNQDESQRSDRPYGDAGNLYEIPRPRSDDPPIRHWWTDDEPQQDGSGSQQSG
jgi:hypothetical protein